MKSGKSLLYESFSAVQNVLAELKKSVGTISQKVLTTNLRLMEEDGLIERKVYAQVPPKVEYTLTDIGYSLAVVLDAMAEWGGGYRQFLKILEKQERKG